MRMLCWSIVDLEFCVSPHCTMDWFSCDIFIQLIYSFLFFCHGVIEHGGVKFLCWTSDPCEVTIRGTDILCKDRVWRKEIILVDSVFQGPLSMHMLEINISVYRCIKERIEEGRKQESRWKSLWIVIQSPVDMAELQISDFQLQILHIWK